MDLKINEYDLETEGMRFKSDFNYNYERIYKLIEMAEDLRSIKIDLVKHKGTKEYYISKRIIDFMEDRAFFITKPLIWRKIKCKNKSK